MKVVDEGFRKKSLSNIPLAIATLKGMKEKNPGGYKNKGGLFLTIMGLR